MPVNTTPINLLAGVDTFSDPLLPGNGELLKLQNLCPNKLGIISKRPSMQHVAWTAKATSAFAGHKDSNYPDVKDFVFITTVPDGVAVAVAGARVVAGTDGHADEGTRVVLVDSTGLIIAEKTLGYIPDRPQMLEINGQVIFLDGLNPGHFFDYGSAAGVIVAIPWTGTPPADRFAPKLAVEKGRRVIYGNLGPGLENALIWSDRDDPFKVSIEFPVSGTDPAPLTALIKASMQGTSTPQTDVVIACTMNHAYFATGFPAQSFVSSSATTDTLSIATCLVNAGCVSHASVATSPYATLWCGPDDVWCFLSGQLPTRVGTKIRDAIQRVAPELRWKIHAEYADGFYRLALPSQEQVQSDVLPLCEQYWLDLRSGVPQQPENAVWYGPMRYVPEGAWDGNTNGTTCMRRNDLGDGRLYSIVSARALGREVSDPGIQIGCALVSFDGLEPVDCCYPRVVDHSQNERAAGTVYANDQVVYFEDFAWRASVAGGAATSASTNAAVLGTTHGSSGDKIIVDGSVDWNSQVAMGDVNSAGTTVYSSAPAFISNYWVFRSYIRWQLLTKELAYGDPLTDKLMDGAEISYACPLSMQIAYVQYPNSIGYSLAAIDPLDPTGHRPFGTLRVLDPSDASFRVGDPESSPADTRRFARDYLPPNPSYRMTAQHAQWGMEEAGPGLLIDDSNDELTSLWCSTGAAGHGYSPMYQVIRTTLPHGNMSQQELATRITARIDALMISIPDVISPALEGQPMSWSAALLAPMFSYTAQDTGIFNTPFDKQWLNIFFLGETMPNGESAQNAWQGNDTVADAVVRRRKNAKLADMCGWGLASQTFTGITGDMIPFEWYPPAAAWTLQPKPFTLAGLALRVQHFNRRDKLHLSNFTRQGS